MATIDLTRTHGKHKKRNISVFSAHIKTGTNDEYVTSADVYQLMVLPENSLILAVGTIILTPNDDTGVATGDFGFDGGAELLNDTDLKGVAGTVVDAQAPVWMPTGGIVTFTPTFANGDATEGDLILWIEYLEVEKTTGELTKFISA